MPDPTPAAPAAPPAPAAPALAPAAPNAEASTVLAAAPVKPDVNAGEKPGDSKGKEGEGAKPPEPKPAAPKLEKYADFKMPEGVTVDADLLGGVAPVLLKHGLTQEAAQELIDAYTAAQVKAEGARQASFAKQVNEEWPAALKTDKVIGGAQYEANVIVAKRAITAFGDQALKDMLQETGLGNHPALVRFAYRAGLTVMEDTIVRPSDQHQGKRPLEERLYPPAQQK